MLRKISIVDYEMGNLHSLVSTLDFLGHKTTLSDQKKDLLNSTHIILPGVGSFRKAMEIIRKKKLDSFLSEAIQDPNIKILGICLGMQLLGFSSEEDGGAEGLNFVDNRILKLPTNLDQKMKVPHVGFNEVVKSGPSKLLKDMGDHSDFYFVHSYGMEVLGKDYETGVTNHSNSFVSVIENENIFGTQFHPEKSQTNGLKLLSNFFT